MTACAHPRVLCLRPKADFDKVGIILPDTLTIEFTDPNNPELSSLIQQASALVIPAVGPALHPDLFVNSNVKLVQVTGAGVDRLDQAGMERLGIPVSNVPGGSNSALAEYAISTSLTLLRRIAWADQEIRNGNYIESRKSLVTELPRGLDGLTVGIIGFGTIGVAVANAFHAFGSKIVFHDPMSVDPSAVEAIGARKLPLDELLSLSDIVSLHVPLLEQTRNLLDGPSLAKMKSSAILINAARGGIVDEASLVAALKSGRLGGAAVDVYAEEPATADNPLVLASRELVGNLLLSPHVAGISKQAWATLFERAWKNVEDVLCKSAVPAFRLY
jgi:phosphoglycerate dehydrogenase-like enzyme